MCVMSEQSCKGEKLCMYSLSPLYVCTTSCSTLCSHPAFMHITPVLIAGSIVSNGNQSYKKVTYNLSNGPALPPLYPLQSEKI